MEQETASPKQHSNSYNIFILVLTVLSLAVMAAMLFPISEETRHLLTIYDNMICIIFLVDFFLALKAAPKKSDYFIKQRGWLDLLGSIPSFGITQYGGLLRLARLSRFARVIRLVSGSNRKQLVDDVMKNRSQYAGFLTILLTVVILTTASVLVLQYESHSTESNIKTGWDAFWYGVVTLTTVGYGDRYPVTIGGRITAMFIMFMGVGIIAVLASILSNLLVGTPPAEEEDTTPVLQASPSIEERLSAMQDEMAAMRQLLEKMSKEDGSM
jgi:voltage-gated potassium channel